MAFGFTATAGTITGTHSGFVGLFTTANFPAGSLSGANAIINGGGNLRAYTDSTKSTALPLEIVTLVTGASSEAQVKVRSNSLATSGTVYFEADDTETTQPVPTAPLGRNAVWTDSEYNNNLDGTGLLNSANGNTGAYESGTPTQVVAKIGDGRDFVSEGIATGESLLASSSSFTISAWCRWDGGTSGAEGTIIDSWDLGNTTFFLRYEPGSGGTIEFQLNDGAEKGSSFSNTSLSDGSFHLIHARLDAGVMNVFKDGVKSLTSISAGTLASTSPASAKIGRSVFNNAGNDFFIGALDEVCVCVAKSDDYIATEYNNQNSPSTFWTSSAWAEQGGGVINVDATLGTIDYTSQNTTVSLTGAVEVVATLGTISYSSQNTIVAITGDIDVVATLGAINYSSQNVDISITGDIDVISTLGTINYSSNGVIVSLSGDINIPVALGAINFSSQNTTVSITGDIDVISTLGTINYESKNASVSLVGGVNVPATLGTINYQSNNALVELAGLIDVNATIGTIFYSSKSTIVKLREGQDIGNVTVSFQDDIYTAGFKPDTITVNFK